MKITNRAAKQLKIIKLVLLTLAVITLFAVVWFAWGPPAKEPVNSYQACIDQGNTILTTYPSQCRTKDGRTFTDPRYDRCATESTPTNRCAKKHDPPNGE